MNGILCSAVRGSRAHAARHRQPDFILRDEVISFCMITKKASRVRERERSRKWTLEGLKEDPPPSMMLATESGGKKHGVFHSKTVQYMYRNSSVRRSVMERVEAS